MPEFSENGVTAKQFSTETLSPPFRSLSQSYLTYYVRADLLNLPRQGWQTPTLPTPPPTPPSLATINCSICLQSLHRLLSEYSNFFSPAASTSFTQNFSPRKEKKMAKSPEQEHPTKAFGWAASDPSGVLSPFKFSRRFLQLLPFFCCTWCLFSFHFLSYNMICIFLMQEIVMFCMISI